MLHGTVPAFVVNATKHTSQADFARNAGIRKQRSQTPGFLQQRLCFSHKSFHISVTRLAGKCRILHLLMLHQEQLGGSTQNGVSRHLDAMALPFAPLVTTCLQMQMLAGQHSKRGFVRVRT